MTVVPITSSVGAPETSKPAKAALVESIFFEGGPVGILLVHSLGGAPAELRLVAQALAREGYTVSCPLLAGHDRSRRELADVSWSEWYAGLEDAHDQLRDRCRFIVVGGLSAGGVMSLRLAAQRPNDVHAIALCSPTLWPDGWNIPWTFNLTKLILHKWSANLLFMREREPFGLRDDRMRRFVLDAMAQQPGGRDRLAGFYGGTILEFRWMVEAVRSSLGSIQQPTLIIHPRHDDRSSLKNAHELASKMGGVTEIVVLDKSYHVCTLDLQREMVIDRMLGFVARVAAEARALETGQSRRSR